jgi:hypothetical protein
LEALRRFLEECPLRVYLERFPTTDGEARGWALLAKDPKALEADPAVSPWLQAHREHLEGMAFFLNWDGRRYRLRLDGVRRQGKEVHLYRLLPEDGEPDLGRRWTEWKALENLLSRDDVEAVHLWAWPWLSEPTPLRKTPYRKGEAVPRARAIGPRLEEALAGWEAGSFAPRPGNACYTCRFEDICRKEEG